MTWMCPKCSATEIDEATVRCVCGYEVVEEVEVQKVIDYQKIGGALYLVLAGLLFTPLINIGAFLDQTKNGLPKAPLELVIVFVTLGFYVFLPVLMILLLIKRKRIFRPTIITFYLLNFLVSLFVYFAVKMMSHPAATQGALTNAKSGVLVAIIGCAVWITYFLKSERARKTLTR